jgi:hypothetical protein
MARTSIALKAALFAFAAGVLGAPMASGEPQPSPNAAPEASTSTPAVAASHYIEFRVAAIGAYGHSYIAYGRLNGKGQPVETRYADLHPTGNYALMALGHIVPVPANTQWDPDVLKLPISSSYRRKLNATEYRNLLAAIQRFRANKQPYWNAVAYNCNNFVADMAVAIGLKAPSPLLASYAFIPALRDMNQGSHSEATPARRAPSAARKPVAHAQSPGT